MKNKRRCKYCGSIWVCWNWFKGDRKWIKEHNPYFYKSDIKLKDIEVWGHECWKCGNCSSTKNKVLNGISYNYLKKNFKDLGVVARRKGCSAEDSE